MGIRIAEEERRKFVNGWNSTMIDIWQERIRKLGVYHTGSLWRSPLALKVRADGRFYDITLSQTFLEYGLWQDLGTGREIPHANDGKVQCLDPVYRDEHNLDEPRKRGPKWGGGETSGHPREPRRWFSTKYYSSVLNLRDFMAESLADEFKGMFCSSLDSDKFRADTAYYRRKGYT
ncbi:hypothetical protein [uncultured Duncaniella sp.]|jgi:hypothetical protein|uniref:hypothetical protein n=1 Tax=uncultured Duncaniella sp. TaxID=2768039 RepID=UPI0025B022E4|nr:hypothetical protein [uncultured Duncaniella sp.]